MHVAPSVNLNNLWVSKLFGKKVLPVCSCLVLSPTLWPTAWDQWCVLGTWPSLIPLLRPLFVLGALTTSDQWINPELCILNVRSTLWDLWNGFDSGLMLEPAEVLLSVTALHKHLLISESLHRALTGLWPWVGTNPTAPLRLSLENLQLSGLLLLISGTINGP